jgi:hypothetical protein
MMKRATVHSGYEEKGHGTHWISRKGPQYTLDIKKRATVHAAYGEKGHRTHWI